MLKGLSAQNVRWKRTEHIQDGSVRRFCGSGGCGLGVIKKRRQGKG